MPDPLPSWYASYSGTGQGEVTRDGFVEPYLGDLLGLETEAHGPSSYFRSRLNFTRTWLGDPAATLNDLLILELYPWHSARITGAMRPPAEVVNDFIWQPLSELAVSHYFAFDTPLEPRRRGHPSTAAEGKRTPAHSPTRGDQGFEQGLRLIQRRTGAISFRGTLRGAGYVPGPGSPGCLSTA